ncbi:MAG: hypothetical protein ACLGIK_08105, partial [Gemmatimonadota bacterium]
RTLSPPMTTLSPTAPAAETFAVPRRGLSERLRVPGIWLAVAVALAPNPFARVFTAVMGGGDEGVVTRSLFGLDRGPVATALTSAFVLAACGPVLLAGWRAVRGSMRPAVYIVLVLLPMLETGVLFTTLNPVLQRGVLASPAWVGAAPLIWVVSAVGVALALAAWPALMMRRAAPAA